MGQRWMFGYKNKPSFVLAPFAKGLIQAWEQRERFGHPSICVWTSARRNERKFSESFIGIRPGRKVAASAAQTERQIAPSTAYLAELWLARGEISHPGWILISHLSPQLQRVLLRTKGNTRADSRWNSSPKRPSRPGVFSHAKERHSSSFTPSSAIIVIAWKLSTSTFSRWRTLPWTLGL